jgi:hypothetical protein
MYLSTSNLFTLSTNKGAKMFYQLPSGIYINLVLVGLVSPGVEPEKEFHHSANVPAKPYVDVFLSGDSCRLYQPDSDALLHYLALNSTFLKKE